MSKRSTKLKVMLLTVLVALMIPTGVIISRTFVAEQNTVTYYKNIKIHDGDTLWSIAKRYKTEHENIKTYIRSIMEINGLKTDLIHSGSYLIVPVQHEIE